MEREESPCHWQIGFDLVGLDNQPEMPQKAEERRLQAPSEIRQKNLIHLKRHANLVCRI